MSKYKTKPSIEYAFINLTKDAGIRTLVRERFFGSDIEFKEYVSNMIDLAYEAIGEYESESSMRFGMQFDSGIQNTDAIVTEAVDLAIRGIHLPIDCLSIQSCGLSDNEKLRLIGCIQQKFKSNSVFIGLNTNSVLQGIAEDLSDVRELLQTLVFISSEDRKASVQARSTNIDARKPIFISGRLAKEDTQTIACIGKLGESLTKLCQLCSFHSFAGTSAYEIAKGFEAAIPTSAPDKTFVFHFRRKQGDAPALGIRFGDYIFHQMNLEEMRESVIPFCKALILIGQGDRAKQEVEYALKNDIPVIPVAFSGGLAEEIWLSSSIGKLLLKDSSEQWRNLRFGSDDGVRAVCYLLRETIGDTANRDSFLAVEL
jgi:hypothetical protein